MAVLAMKLAETMHAAAFPFVLNSHLQMCFRIVAKQDNANYHVSTLAALDRQFGVCRISLACLSCSPGTQALGTTCDVLCRQLKAIAPSHILVQRVENADEAFKHAASAFEVSA